MDAFRRLALFAAIVAGVIALVRCEAASAHDGVPPAYQPMCCVDECAAVDDYAERLDAGTYRLMRSGREIPASRTFFSTNGATIICKYPRGGVRCLFIPKPTVS